MIAGWSLKKMILRNFCWFLRQFNKEVIHHFALISAKIFFDYG